MNKVPFLDFVHTRSGWHWRISARNGRILCASEVYSSYTKAAYSARRALSLDYQPRPYHVIAQIHLTRVYEVRHWDEA